jgi:hypothetical protein
MIDLPPLEPARRIVQFFGHCLDSPLADYENRPIIITMRIPDRFDLCVRKVKKTVDPNRQLDILLGALLSKEELFFWNIGSKNDPQPATALLEDALCLIIFSDGNRLQESMENLDEQSARKNVQTTGLIGLPAQKAFQLCVDLQAGLLVNPLSGEDNFHVAAEPVKTFFEEWKASGHLGTGFWVPSMTDEEEDFWQENGL